MLRATRRLAASSAGAGPPAGRQRDDRGRVAGRGAEQLAEAADAGHVGPAEAVDRLVGVADRHQVAAVAGQQRQQRDLRRVGVLQLVHEHVRPRRPLGREQRRAPAPRGPRPRGSARPGRSSPRPASAVTPAYCRMNRAAARQSSRPWTRPSRSSSCGVTPRSYARITRSRSSCAKPRVGSAGCRRCGQSGAPAARSPSSRSRTTRSCSGPASRRGDGSPRSAASRRSTPNA